MNVEPRLARPKEQAGQSLVEFALVLMFIILPFMFVLTDGAFTLYTYAMLTNAAREGARAGSIYQTATPQSDTQTFDQYYAQIDTERRTYTRQETQRLLGNLVSFAQCSTPIAYTPNTPDTGNPFREMDSMSLQVACPRRMFFGLIGTSQITLSAQSTMRIEPGGVGAGP
jgi:Flp pilus assembly protein TadG